MNMGSLSTPKTWPPYMNTKDCSQGFCSLNCPQWCYLIFPPPPPMASSSSSSSSSSFSPLVITIIGILASAFLLVSYYAVISKFCRPTSDRSRATWPNMDDMENNNHNESDHVDLWNTRAAGLDEALIKLISVIKYNKGDGVFSSTDCSVCLGEFEEGEDLRLLPKCNHAFHVSCIDKWLKTHSSCPLCRSNIVSMFTLDTTIQPPGMLMHQQERMESQGGEEHEELLQGVMINVPSEIVEIRDEAELRCSMRRSVSMDDSREMRISIEEEDFELHGSSAADYTKDQPSMRMKRSLSSGRFSFTRRS